MRVKVFYTPTCSKCPRQKEIVSDIADDAGVEYEFVDATENMDEANRYSVRSFPTTVVLDDEQVVDQFIGLTNRNEIEAQL